MPLFTLLSPLQRTLARWAADFLIGGLFLYKPALAASGAFLGLAELEAKYQEKESNLAKMVERIERSISSGDPRYLDSIFDQDAVLQRVTGSEVPESEAEMREVFHTGTKQAWQSNSPAVEFLGQDVRFLRVKEIQGVPGLLFRAVAANGGLNYHLFCIQEKQPGNYAIVDLFNLGLNEFTTSTLRRSYRHLVNHYLSLSAETGEIEHPCVANDFVKHLPTIGKINQALANQNGDAALLLLDSLPASLSQDRSLLVLRLDASQLVGKTKRQESLETWRKAFPDEGELPLRWAECYLDQQRWPDAKRLLQLASDRVGGDSYLQFQIGQLTQKIKASSPLVTLVK
jgi:hypothetical protein